MQVFNIAINNIEYTISQLVYISSSVATSINLFKNSKMRDSIAVLMRYPNQIVNQLSFFMNDIKWILDMTFKLIFFSFFIFEIPNNLTR